MIYTSWPVYQSVSDAGRFVRALKIAGISQSVSGNVTISFGDGYGSIDADDNFNSVWLPAVGGWVVQAADGSMSYLGDKSFTAQYQRSSGSKVQPGDIGGGATGIGVLKSEKPIDARTAIGLSQADYGYVVGNRTGGDPTIIPVTTNTNGNTIAQRDQSGAIATATPVSNAHAANKAYVDNLKPNGAGSADKITSARLISLSGAMTGNASFDGTKDVTINASLANNAVTDAAVSAANPIKGGKVVTSQQLVSAGKGITILAGTKMDDAIQAIIDKVTPSA